MNKKIEKIAVSAFSEDYSEKAYKFYFANHQFEFVPKSLVSFSEDEKGKEFGEGIKSRWFIMPVWLAKKLKGSEYYSFN